MSSTARNRRLSRIRRRGSPELVAALDAGQISIRLADTLFYLPPEEQRAELQRRLQTVQERERRSAIAARVIRGYLGSASRVDLQELRRSIEAALNSPASV